MGLPIDDQENPALLQYPVGAEKMYIEYSPGRIRRVRAHHV